MRTFLLITSVVVMPLADQTAPADGADGFVRRLPPDGAWARFDVEITSQKMGDTRSETIILKSVGQRQENNEKRRWLEFKLPLEEQTETIKLLIPEKHLAKAESPLEHVVRGWRKLDDEVPVSLASARTFWLEALLPRPLTDTKALGKELVKSPLGDLQCEGVSGRAHVIEDDGHELTLTYSIRLHEKAPFGVVTYRFECRVSRNNEALDTVIYDLKLADLGDDAKTEMPGYE